MPRSISQSNSPTGRNARLGYTSAPTSTRESRRALTGSTSIKGWNNGVFTGDPSNRYVPPSNNTIKIETPVITAQDAKADYQKKLATLKDLTSQIKNQGDIKANQKAQLEQAKAQADVIQSELNMKQQGIDIQRTQAEATNAIADSRRRALDLVNEPSQNVSTPPAAPQGNPLAPPANETSVPPPSSPPGQVGQAENQGINDATNSYQDAVTGIQTQRDSLAAQTSQRLDSLMRGTIPLSAPQSALISSLQAQLHDNEAYQRVANEAYTGQITESAFRTGGEYTPAQMAGQIHNAVSAGVAKVQELDNKAASTIAQLEVDFQHENFDIINKNYDVLTKQLDAKSSAIKDIYDSTIKTLQDARDFNAKQTQLNIENKVNSDKFSYQQKQDAIDNAFKSGQISETKRHNLAQEALEWAKMKEPTAADKKATEEALKNSKSAVPIMQDKIKDIDNILVSEGLNSRVGTNILSRTAQGPLGALGKAATVVGIPGLGEDTYDKLTGAGQEFSGSVHKLVSGLTLQSLIDAKSRGATFGALSEGELNILANSASQLNDWEMKDKNGNGKGIWNIDEKSFKKELKNIQDLTRRALILSGESLISSDEESDLDRLFGPTNRTVNPSLYY